MQNVKIWIEAFRLRTLPLALSCIILGSLLAYAANAYNAWITTLAITTTLFLQILSNLANDYGDGVKGTDNEDRVGPARAIQKGAISPQSMRTAMYIFSGLSLISGIGLIYLGLKDANLGYSVFFFLLGLGAIAAAIKYTVGKNAYGYSGMGDLFVFLFFGLIGVCGTFYLHTGVFDPLILLPASAIGFLSAGVLNLNNMRDRESDKKAGKNTLVVKLGKKNAQMYHAFLLIGALVCGIVYNLLAPASAWQYIFLIISPLLFLNLKTVFQHNAPKELDPLLKKLALTSLLFCIVFGIGQLL